VPEQSIQILELLLEHPGDLVSREQLRQRLWPSDTFVDFEHGVNAAVRRLRDALGDSAETPRFIETLPRRGYRFIGAIGESIAPTPVGAAPSASASTTPAPPERKRWRRRTIVVALLAAIAVFGIAASFVLRRPAPTAPAVPSLSAVTFEQGVQKEPTWSPDGLFIAYASNQSGNFDIWVQAVAGGEPHRLTTNPAHDWQPAWSADGKFIAFRSERNGGGIFLVRAPLGGDEQQLSDVGYWPQWSRDGKLLVFSQMEVGLIIPEIYLLDPTRPQSRTRILQDELAKFVRMRSRIVWHPDGQRVSFWGTRNTPTGPTLGFWTLPIAGGEAKLSEIPKSVRQEANAQFVLAVLSGVTWAPSGDALYLQATSVGNWLDNIWTVDIDPLSLSWRGGLRRLTTGTDQESAVSVAAVGDRLALVVTTRIVRLWSLPLDPRTGRPTEVAPTALTPASMRVESFDVSADGNTLAYNATLHGKSGRQLLSSSFDGRPPIKLDEGSDFFAPRLSFDGAFLIYRRPRSQREGSELVWRTTDGTGMERVLPQGPDPAGWSPDGERFLHGCTPPGEPARLCVSPARATTLDQTRKVLSDPVYSFWQGRFSSSGRWILFNATRHGEGSVLGVVAAEGGEGKWIRLTDAHLGADKARWAHDGKAIYFIGSRDSDVNHVWRLEFDPDQGAVIGGPIQLTHYDDPARTISKGGNAELGVSATRLVVSIVETTSSHIWKILGVKGSPR